MKNKKLLFWVLSCLAAGLIIAAIVIISVQSCAPKSNGPTVPVEPGPDDPPDDPPDVPPGHEHEQWLWTFSGEWHWQYAICHPSVTRNRGMHVYGGGADDKFCDICNYERVLPTKQDKIEVEFGDNGASVGGFTGDSVQDLVIPGTVTDKDGKEVEVVEITKGAFSGNQTITTLTILDGVKKIDENAFAGCTSLEKIILPKSIEEIDPSAFYNCKALKYITVDDSNPIFRSLYNCIVSRAEHSIVLGCIGSSIDTNSANGVYFVSSISSSAFYGSGIENIEIPENIEFIGAEAFKDCTALTEITIPASVNSISNGTFKNCTALTAVNMHDGITSIGQNAFENCSSLDNVVLPSGLKAVQTSTFSKCTSLETIILNEGLTAIDTQAFQGCTKLKSVTLPSTVRGVGMGAFADCTSLNEIVFNGTAEDWDKVAKKGGWKPATVEVTFSKSSGDSGDGTDNQED